MQARKIFSLLRTVLFQRAKEKSELSAFTLREALLVAVGLASVWIVSCKIEEFTGSPTLPAYNANWAVPFGRISTTSEQFFGNIMGKGFTIQKREDGLLFMQFRSRRRLSLDNALMRMPRYAFDYQIRQRSNVPSPQQPPLHRSIRESTNYSYNTTDSSRIDSVVYKEATLEVRKLSSFGARVRTQISFPSLRAPGESVATALDFDANYSGNLPIVLTEERDLTGYRFSFTEGRESTDTDNMFATIFDIDIEQRSGEVLREGNRMVFGLRFSDATFEAMYGHFKTQNIELMNEELEVGGLRNLQNRDSICFNRAALSFNIDNFYGLPMSISFNGMGFVRDDNVVDTISGDALTEDYFIDSPSRSEIGDGRRSVVVFGEENSNVATLMAREFDNMHLPMYATINPSLPNPQRSDNFLIEGQYLEVETELNVPLDVVLKGLILTSKFPSSYRSSEAENYIKSAYMRIVTDNSLPLRGTADIQFMSRDGTMFYKIKNQPIISAPKLDARGRSMETKRKVTDVPLDQDAFEKYMESDSTFLVIRYYSPRGANGETLDTKLYVGDGLDIRLAVSANTRVRFPSEE